MQLKVEFYNAEKDQKVENYIINFLKKHFTQRFIRSISVVVKRQPHKYLPWKLEIELNSEAGSILHTQSRAEDSVVAFSQAVHNLERKVIKIRA